VAGRAIDRRFVITITDEGIGMDDERLAAANALLARPPAPGLSLSRTLGLYVVAHLAARHGIHVQLRHAPGTGLTAVVGLPTDVLARIDQPPAPERSREPASRPAVFVGEPVDVGPAPEVRSPVAEQPTERRPSVPTIAWRGSADEDDGLLRRGSAGGGGTGGNGGGNGDESRHLAARTPGANLSQPPGERVSTTPSGARPRPERVAELLHRHERGKREGRERPPGDQP
jgi:hypothetical protein